MRLILGSASPRRRDLLAQIGVVPSAILPANIDETPHPRELPRPYVQRMAEQKCTACLTAMQSDPGDGETLVLTADTVVSAGRRILGKPEGADEARAFLTLLGGRRHRVTTSVCLWGGGGLHARTIETRVKMKRLSHTEIEAYLASGEWQGKAGGYAIQGIASAFVPEIIGSYTNVVGLPLTETAALLIGAGFPVSFKGDAA